MAFGAGWCVAYFYLEFVRSTSQQANLEGWRSFQGFRKAALSTDHEHHKCVKRYLQGAA